jgi:hypothetical protein
MTRFFLFEEFSNDLVVKRGTELYHATVEKFDKSSLRGGGYDKVLWTTMEPGISQTYIPKSGSRILTSSEKITQPAKPNTTIWNIQQKLGIHYDQNKIEWSGSTAKIYAFPDVFSDFWEKYKYGTEVERAKNEYVNQKLTELGYEPTHNEQYSKDHTWILLIDNGELVPAKYKATGRLLIITPKEDLKIYDMTLGGKRESDLTDLDYHKIGVFKKAEASGYDGIKITDFAQTEELGNFGHYSIGLFPSGLKKVKIEEVEASYPDDFENMYKKNDYRTKEYLSWKKS